LEEGVDLLILQAFPSLEPLQQVYEIVKSLAGSIPVLPMLAFQVFQIDRLMLPVSFIETARQWGARLVGVSGGCPKDLLEILPLMTEAAGNDIHIAMMPDAGSSEVIDCRTLFLASPEYMAEYARRLFQKGAAILGGDAGITPRMIREMSSYLRSVQPRNQIEVLSEPEESSFGEEALKPIPIDGRSPFGRSLKKKFVVSVELDPPKGIDASRSVQGQSSCTNTASTPSTSPTGLVLRGA
jgi:homocysteine S-methyltransferase